MVLCTRGGKKIETSELETIWTFTRAMIVEFENVLLRCAQHLEHQVLTTNMQYF